MQLNETLAASPEDLAAIHDLTRILRNVPASALYPLKEIRPGQKLLQTSRGILRGATFPLTRQTVADTRGLLDDLAWLYVWYTLPRPLVIDLAMIIPCTLVGGLLGLVGVTTRTIDSLVNRGHSFMVDAITDSFLKGFRQAMTILCAVGAENGVNIRHSFESGDEVYLYTFVFALTAWRSRGAPEGTLYLASGETLSASDCPIEWIHIFQLVEQFKWMLEGILLADISEQDTVKFLLDWLPRVCKATRTESQVERFNDAFVIVVAQMRDLSQTIRSLMIFNEKHGEIMAQVSRIPITFSRRVLHPHPCSMVPSYS
jgi:hypothetical protein